MKYYNNENYINTQKILEKLPFIIENIELDTKYICIDCGTNGFSFQIYIDYSLEYVDLLFDSSMYGEYSIVQCDFRNSLDYNSILNKYGYDLPTENVKSFFEDKFEDIYKYYVYHKYIIERNKYQSKYSLEVEKLLELLRKDNNEFYKIENWVSNCYAVSDAIYRYINIDNLELVYGKWFGFVAKDSHFDKGVSNHGWLEFKLNNNTIVIDPTRWVFENVEPYIYIDIKGVEYDRAGQRFIKTIKENYIIPEKIEGDKIINISFGEEINNFLLNNILEGKYEVFTLRTLLYISNLPIDLLGDYKKVFFQILIDNGLNYMIPIDTKELVFGYKN